VKKAKTGNPMGAKVSAQAAAVAEKRGMASAQRVVLFMRVRIRVLPLGRREGTTRSMWT
jgi:hypothetical protein